MSEFETSNINLNNLILDSNQNFLILDDDEQINETLVEFLKVLGFNGKFLTANSILEAKKHLKFEKIDFILSDWKLPDGQGIALLKAIRKSVKYRDIPFIMVTGKDDVESLITSHKMGSSEYIVKPISLDTFKEKLAQGWKSHVQPDMDKMHSLNQKILELEDEIENLRSENLKLKQKLGEA
jgi:two-component system chemotaxis response regulator CheY